MCAKLPPWSYRMNYSEGGARSLKVRVIIINIFSVFLISAPLDTLTRSVLGVNVAVLSYREFSPEYFFLTQKIDVEDIKTFPTQFSKEAKVRFLPPYFQTFFKKTL